MAKRYPQRRFSLPADATEVVLVRHGASQDAVPGTSFALLGDHADPPLSAVGEQQARLVAEQLRREPAARLFVTPLQRTRQTAAPLAAATGLAPVVVPELREVHLGEWEGGRFRIAVAERDPIVARIFEEQRWDAIPGAEDMDAFEARTRAGIERVVAAVGPGRSGVAVVHGGVIGELCRQATGGRRLAFIHADNASISRLVVFGDGRWLLRSFNDIAHLIA